MARKFIPFPEETVLVLDVPHKVTFINATCVHVESDRGRNVVLFGVPYYLHAHLFAEQADGIYRFERRAPDGGYRTGPAVYGGRTDGKGKNWLGNVTDAAATKWIDEIGKAIQSQLGSKLAKLKTFAALASNEQDARLAEEDAERHDAAARAAREKAAAVDGESDSILRKSAPDVCREWWAIRTGTAS